MPDTTRNPQPIRPRPYHDGAGIDRLRAIVARLRDPAAGCPWDIAQTPATIAPYTIEEAHEVADAIARQAWGELEGELGDLLLQVVLLAQMGEEAGQFGWEGICTRIADKMIARHPHIFGSQSRDKSADQQARDWEAIKAAERGAAGTLAGVALALPALTRAVKLQARAARVGFDWPSVAPVLDKIAEEARELAAAPDAAARTEEVGDLLFVVANLARHLKIDPEAALRASNSKFERRFGRIEAWLALEGRLPADATLAEMDALWDRAKAEERGQA